MNHTHLTLEEQERAAYIAGDTRTAELLGRVDELDGLEESTEQRYAKEYEVAEEQSEFRRALIEDIEHLCEQAKSVRFKETKELAASILKAIDDSYVEI